MALCVMLVVWLAHTSGIFRCADDYLADLSQARQTTSHVSNNVLLVYTDRQVLRQNDGRLIDLIDSIRQYRPSQIGIAYQMPAALVRTLASSDLSSSLVIGDTISNLRKQAADPDQDTLRRGFLDFQLYGQSTYRWHRSRVIGSSCNVDSLEACLARTRLSADCEIPFGEFGIRFQGGAAGLPHVEDSSFLDGTVISELVEDRIVLIGAREENAVGFVTPSTAPSDRMSRLELHGNILETILAGNAIFRTNAYQDLMILLIITISSAIIFRRVSTRWIVRSGIVWLAVLAVAFWLTLTLFSIQLGMVAIISTAMLNFVIALKTRFQILSHFFDQWKLVRRTNIKKTWNASYDEIWTSVATSALQIFHPNRLVMLELETGSAHLEVREVVGCDETAIQEKRRDVSRLPFRHAIELRSPVSIDDRPFLSTDEDGRQFMVPLIDGSDVQGVMVLEMDRSALTENDFEDRLSEFADRMAVFLKETRERELEQIVSRMPLRRLRYIPERIAARALFQDEVDQRRYEDLLSRALDCSEVAVAIYDVFGNLLKSNKRMIDHLQERDIVVGDSNVADIVSAFTGRSVRSSRELVRQCLIGNHAEEILLASENEDRAAGVLYVKPLRPSDQDADHGVENRCISIQYVDGGVFASMHDWETRFASSQSEVLRDQISRLNKCLSQMDGDHGDPALADYTELAHEMLDAVDQCQAAINFGLSERPEDFLLVNAGSILNDAVEACKEECESRGVNIRLNRDVDDDLAISNPILLRRVFAFAIEALLNDASRQTDIKIDVSASENRLRYRFDVVSRRFGNGDSAVEQNKSWKVSESTGHGKAAMVLLRKHSDQLIQVSRWLRQWGATLKYECAQNYQPSIEIDLACDETDRHSDVDVGESAKSASDSTATETGNA